MIRFKLLDSTVHMRVSDASTINGKDGVTPHIGDNGNWYLGDVDTGNPSRGETGPAGKTPVRGTDYWTEADQNAIVSQAVTKIQPDISGINDDLATKLNAPPTAEVGQIFRIKSINEDGSLTLEAVDMPTDNVTDVQINGTSILTNGVANIPIASEYAGVVRAQNVNTVNRGVYISSEGFLSAYNAVKKNIDGRVSQNSISPTNLDYAVKAAMCDGKGATWTAYEQAAARERIGASKKLGIWEDIAIVNITEEAAAITVNLDANGNTFSLSDIICEITIPAENPVKQRIIYFGAKILTNFAFSRIALTTTASYISGAITYARIVSGRVICDGAISGPSNTRYQPYNKYAIFNGYGGIEAESFDSVSVFTYSDAFPAGTTVILKGIRT